jgi:Xaa-Pro dipeptidase
VSAPPDEAARLSALVAAEGRALSLLDAIEASGMIAAGRTEREVEQDIRALAADAFGIERHWHKRIVRCGANTLAIAGDNPPVLTIAADDTVFLDIGPVLGEWEADVGRTYVVGDDPERHALCRHLPILFDRVRDRFEAEPDVTGAMLYAYACAEADHAGWIFGGEIAGHLVAEFPHARLPGDKAHRRIAPDNPTRMRDPDALGRVQHWILEIHLVAPDGSFGGFYERLLDGA